MSFIIFMIMQLYIIHQLYAYPHVATVCKQAMNKFKLPATMYIEYPHDYKIILSLMTIYRYSHRTLNAGIVRAHT